MHNYACLGRHVGYSVIPAKHDSLLIEEGSFVGRCQIDVQTSGPDIKPGNTRPNIGECRPQHTQAIHPVKACCHKRDEQSMRLKYGPRAASNPHSITHLLTHVRRLLELCWSWCNAPGERGCRGSKYCISPACQRSSPAPSWRWRMRRAAAWRAGSCPGPRDCPASCASSQSLSGRRQKCRRGSHPRRSAPAG